MVKENYEKALESGAENAKSGKFFDLEFYPLCDLRSKYALFSDPS